ncbi:FAD-dependent monooxygenase, partial [Streptomyces mirabilis]
MDPVIIVGAGPVGLTLALALARQEVPCVVLDEGPGKDEQRLARTVVLREDAAALVERLTGLPLTDAGFRWAGWRSMRRKQVMREIDFAARASDTHSPDFEADAHGSGGAAHGAGGGAHG